MTGGSRVRYLFGTSKATLAAVPLLVAVGYAVLPTVPLWRGDWWWGFNHLVQAVPIAVVLTAFVAGWDAGATGSGDEGLRRRVPVEGWRIHATLFLPPFAAAAGPYLLGLLVVLVATVEADGVVDRASVLVVITHLSMFALAAVVGLAVGRVLTSPYAAVGAAAAMTVLLFWSVPGGFSLFSFPGASGPAVEQTAMAARYGIAPLGLLVAAGCLVVPTLPVVARRGPVLGGVLAAIAVIWVSSLVVSPDMYVGTGERPDRCRTTSITTCVYPGYDRLARPASEALERMLTMADGRGVPASSFPDRYEQGGNIRSPAGVGELALGTHALRDRSLSTDDVVQSLTTPLWCAEMFGDVPPLALLARRDLVADWLYLVAGVVPPGNFVTWHPEQKGRSPQQVAAAVRTALAEMRTCANT